MATEKGNAMLQALEEGKRAFHAVEKNAKGFWMHPANPYKPKSMYYKEWERGFNKEYFNALRRSQRAA